MATNKTFNGAKNWNHWNVSLWINNDESLYSLVKECIKDAEVCEFRKKGESVRELAAKMFMCRVDDEKTPDGAPYSVSSIRAAMVGM